MNGRLPLSALLSRALVAFIVEFDNEFELRTPHQTSDYGGVRGAPWLVSMVVWLRFLRFIPDEGIPLEELQKRTGVPKAVTLQWIARLGKWWGYVIPGPVVRPTPGGRRAFESWRPLTGIIEKRWEQRFGEPAVGRLRAALAPFATRFPDLPDFMPVLGFGLWSKPSGPLIETTASLPGLLSKVLLGFTLEYESQSMVSLAIGANVLRLVPDEGVRLRDLPRLSGVSKESIAMAAKFLEKQGFAHVEPVRLLRLTQKGVAAREEYARLVCDIGKKWNPAELRAALEPLDIEPPIAPPGTWRAQVPRPATLPEFPMILHRGGYPDGS